MTDPLTGWDRATAAADAVRDRMRRAAAALDSGAVPYAVAGGHAVAVWVESAGEGGVRNMPDVDILIRRADFPAAKAAIEAAGFVYRHSASIDMFLDGKGAKARDAVRILYAGEKVRADAVAVTPDVADATRAAAGHQVVTLDALVTMKLTSYRDKDRTHLRDMISVGLIDATWPARFPPPLGERLQAVLDDPDG